MSLDNLNSVLEETQHLIDQKRLNDAFYYVDGSNLTPSEKVWVRAWCVPQVYRPPDVSDEEREVFAAARLDRAVGRALKRLEAWRAEHGCDPTARQLAGEAVAAKDWYAGTIEVLSRVLPECPSLA